MERRTALRVLVITLAAPFVPACSENGYLGPTADTLPKPAPEPDPKYVYFGRVDSGQSVLEALRKVGLSPVTRTNWESQVNGQPGVVALGGVTGDWRFEVNRQWFVQNVSERKLERGDLWGAWHE